MASKKTSKGRKAAKAAPKSAKRTAKPASAKAKRAGTRTRASANGAGIRSGDALVIVESPTKARTIGKYLGPGYAVRATVGHVRDLPTRKLGVEIEGDGRRFLPHPEGVGHLDFPGRTRALR